MEAGSTVQRQLSEYLQYELYHILGAYGIAEKRHERLAQELDQLASLHALRDEQGSEAESHPNQLAFLARLASRYNRQLGSYRHGKPRDSKSMHPFDETSKGWPFRDPIPDDLPLTSVKRFELGANDRAVTYAREHPWKESYAWERIPRFYSEAIFALEAYADKPSSTDGDHERQHEFATSLVAQRDGATPPLSAPESTDVQALGDRVSRRRNRYLHRRSSAHRILAPHQQAPISASKPHESSQDIDDSALASLYSHDSDFLWRLCTDNLSTDGDSLPVYVVRVLAEAHLSMHAVEAWQSMCLGEHADAHTGDARNWLSSELDRCVALNTFAYCVSRTAPWLFAADRHESARVFNDFHVAWENVVPARGMWIAGQVGLLALHRRAYARALKGDSVPAYNDYHKLQRLIRDAERRVRAAPIHVDGALEFLAALDAQAHHHIGELYREEHAHRPARKHFNRASHRLDVLREQGAITDVLTNSRWSVELQVSHGKAAYEMGRHKEALCWHLRGWQAFLRLLAADTETATNTDAIQAAIDWLERVRYDPEVRKVDLAEHLGPVVEQLRRVTVSRRYGALAGEILLRLGHLLLVLNLGGERANGALPTKDRRPDSRTLAYTCLDKALECDRYSTLISTDLLKASFRLNAVYGGSPPAGTEKYPEPFLSVGEQWPRGGNDFEQLARAAEYLTLRRQRTLKLAKGEGEARANAPIARDLLLSFFMNTDSINVRKSQVYRLLMHEARPSQLPQTKDVSAIEFICMRRYSSAFPLLPRPSAFRALGGGYFVRLHDRALQPAHEPFGIVIDPGVDFVENLYRSGHSLGDINMILVTHDHVDHAGSLDILLSLLHVRAQTLRHERVTEMPPPVTILLSQSVYSRYKEARQLESAREFTFQCIEQQIGRHTTSGALRGVIGLPAAFELVAMSTKDIDGKGHLDLSGRPAYGICIRARKHTSTSVALTSDAPPPPLPQDRRRYRRWRSAWAPALEARILVAHLSSVPLTELRQASEPEPEFAGARTDKATLTEVKSIEHDMKHLDEIRCRLQAADAVRAGLIEYGLWLRSHGGAPPAPIVGPVAASWRPPSEHSFLKGILRWARTFAEAERQIGPSLFVVGELSEELGTMRGKVASSLNERVFRKAGRRMPSVCALSGDIGLSALVTPAGAHARGSQVKVLCTTCNLDTDRVLEEQYHFANNVLETCVKGENEGMFYNCREHAPGEQPAPMFLEALERFDIFGR